MPMNQENVNVSSNQVPKGLDERKHAFFSHYRKWHPDLYSDSSVTYDVELTEELFDLQMHLLSTQKKQSEFENFVIALATRLITPNIKPQTGPDGGGDGKVDAETYEVSEDVADKWVSVEHGANGSEKWAFAVSCKAQVHIKLGNDVKNIVETKRGYSRILFFTNQYVKASKRIGWETELKEKYHIKVDLFDALWCKNAVFHTNCKDLALKTLSFSDQYKRKHENVGPRDCKRLARLDEISKSINRKIDGLDTSYIEELREDYTIRRGLERPRQEIDGSFARAQAECGKHGSEQQAFLIVYDHAWTSLFWFEDLGTAYIDYQKLKEYVNKVCTVVRLEKLTNVLSILRSASQLGLFENDKIELENAFIDELSTKLVNSAQSKSCSAFLQLHMAEQQIIRKAARQEDIAEELKIIRSLLLGSNTINLDISLGAQCRCMEILSKVVYDDSEFDDLVDDLAEKLSERVGKAEAAKIRMNRAQALMEKGRSKEAIKQLGPCIYAFETEETVSELIRSSMFMALCLWDLQLPYSSEMYFVRALSFMLNEFYASGHIGHGAFTALRQICNIELMLGRLVMYLNWHKLLMIIAQNSEFTQDKGFVESQYLEDAAWLCRYAATNFDNKIVQTLPDILEREGLVISSDFIKYKLGYADEICESAVSMFGNSELFQNILKQPVFEQFLSDLNISTGDYASLESTVTSVKFIVKYTNTCFGQRIAELILSSIEALLATTQGFEMVPVQQSVYINLEERNSGVDIEMMSEQNKYTFYYVNGATAKEMGDGIVKLIAYLLSRNFHSDKGVVAWLSEKQSTEYLFDRVSSMLRCQDSGARVLGVKYRNKIDDWRNEGDREYLNRCATGSVPEAKTYDNKEQNKLLVRSINENMSLWNGAGWSACMFIGAENTPPILALAFTNYDKGSAIVTEWKSLTRSQSCPIKIYIVKGINAKYPTWYRVCIVPVFLKDDLIGKTYGVSICRNLTMTPTNNRNLGIFEEGYRRYGCCYLMAYELKDKSTIEPPKDFSTAFMTKNVEVINAYEIDDRSEAKMALSPKDDVFIPEEWKDGAPVIAVLRKMREPVSV